MADTDRVVGQNEPIMGIKAETTYGESLDSVTDDITAYRQLPLVTAIRPQVNMMRESRLLSGRGFVKNQADTYHSGKGGTVITPFDFFANPKLLSQFLVLTGQVHSEAGAAGSEIHTITFDDSGMINEIAGTKTANIPLSVNLAWYSGAASEGIRIVGNIVSDLTLTLAAGSNGNLMTMSGNFFSGHANLATGTTASQSCHEVEFTTSGWTQPDWAANTNIYYAMDLYSKTLDVDDGSASAFIMKSITFNISNGANRVGSDVSGDAENIALPEYVITGEMQIKYDDAFDYGATKNVLQDFIDGDILSLALKWGDGTVSSAGEMNIDAELEYPDLPPLDLSEAGIFHVLPFECKVNSTTPALKFQIFVGESQTAW